MIPSDGMEVDKSCYYNFYIKRAEEKPNKPCALHARILRLYSDCTHIPEVKLYLSFYLEKAANWSTTACKRSGRQRSIKQVVCGSSADYFRSMNPKGYFLAEIYNTFFSAQDSGIPIYAVRSAESVKRELEWEYEIYEPRNVEEMITYLKAAVASSSSSSLNFRTRILISIDHLIYQDEQKRDKRVVDLVIHYNKLISNILSDTQRVDYICFTLCRLSGQDFIISTASIDNDKLNNFWTGFFTARGDLPTIIQREQLLLNLRGFPFPSTSPLNTEEINWSDYNCAASVLQRLPIIASDSSLFSLLYQANRDLLAGLSSNLERLRSPDAQKVIQRSLRSIEESMILMFQYQGDHSTFTFQHELIAEEILLLLNLTNPYHPGQFSEIVVERIKNAVPQLEIIPQVIPFSSGMHTIQEILQAMRTVTDLVIAKSPILYFEIDSLLGDDEMSPLETPNFAFFSFRSLLNYEVHYNSYLTICKRIDELLKLNSTEKQPLFIAVDVTLDKLQSKVVYKLIKHYQNQIQSKNLSIVLFRSCQKFDQLGVDKFNAGYLELYSENPNISSAFDELSEDQLQGLDYQALCHYHRCIPGAIHQYPKFHYKNVRHFQELADGDQKPFENFEVVLTEDSKMPFFRLQLEEDFTSAKLFKEKLWKTMEDWKIPCSLRQSFGYHQPTVTFNTFDAAICARISIGTAPSEEVTRFYEALKVIDEQLNPFGDDEMS